MSTLQARSEALLNASVSRVWAIVTDITLLPRINPGVIKVSGAMNEPNAVRTCEVESKGRKGIITEKLVEFVPEKRMVWKVESDTMGMSKMLLDTRFSLLLETVTDSSTKVTAETHYSPRTILARMMNGLMMKKMFAKAQEKILQNLRALAQNQ
ncbi:MAG TPA: SRPBCC family protein [Puia sp.]|nr:SRPBCC family protein [Puia sp.]